MYQNKITHYCFDTSGVFAQYEEQAIDGQLDYNDYPPEEYRYFSKLSRLGYNNRHMGWSKEICEQKQEEYRKDYREACAERSARLAHMKRLNADLIRAQKLSRRLYRARSKAEALPIALELIEKLTNEPGLKQRIENNLQEEQS